MYRKFENDDPRMPWNSEAYRDDPREMWNDPRYEDDPRSPWNNPASSKRDYDGYKRKHNRY